MKIINLTELLRTARLIGDGETEITDVQTDSRKVKPGDLFICLPGHTVDGHDYAAAAASRGAAAFVVERELEGLGDAPQIIVKDSRHAMAVLADAFFRHPSQSVKTIGVTGTNGKTTTTYLIERMLSDHGHSTGVIGTIEMRYAGRTFPMSGTTPEALELQRSLADMKEAGVSYCAMEVSSHALEQGRVKGTRFRTAVFTNLTQDHLDYHKTMESYAAAKGLLFSRLGNSYAASEQERSYAVLNADDEASALFAKLTAAEVITYGIDHEADLRASDIRITAKGTSFHVHTYLGDIDITLQMVGKFNVYNALGAMAAALIEGLTLEQVKASLEAIAGVPGRVESVNAGQDFAVIVDYAHTPDGLENVLAAVSEFAPERILCVFGCGGDRDRTKRPIMAQIAAKYSDYIFVTSDNPRTEDPALILKDVEAGLIELGIPSSSYECLVDRRQAIQKAVEMASSGDVVLIAGKGHETYQIIGKVTHDFDDRLVAEEAIRGLRT
ncbi:UDP-N-acetylmuramoyl-L-alanyl-D-glutamate--2,6-diaminopimelate ligase [Paenibacillus sp. GCM10023252]|uniref:UDP-N-acetylmuramoyl-L-alanyl-D-glutamate--2, 6-diaminopimelate ligase n=1 Tax=Paenibacillus sp. GCM10023252 TaxID=3252649 RepID=UPI003608D2B8